ncbi:(2Fe-2S)-binding protein [bacterium]|nr:(2Fe-2S)-binding protein [bacterium]
MITLEIDHKTVQAEEGQSIIEVAWANGIEIPHFCWHPGLSVAGNCRMCLVEIDQVPKLQIACATPVCQGMKVFTKTERVIEARRGILEFLLINHPVDCPICDQAGECFLQDYYQEHGLYKSRFKESKVKKGKVIDLGSDVVLDQERCVLCSRCVRFLQEIAHDEQLAIFERGDRSEIRTVTQTKLDSLYAGNLYEICPVGALTSRDFRFQCRVWYLDSTPSVCPGCSRGCSIFLDHYQNKVYRVRARFNPQVNQYWLCDLGRASYKQISSPDRLRTCLLKRDQGLIEADYETVLNEAAARLNDVLTRSEPKSIAVMGSPQLSNEEAYLLKTFTRDVLKTRNIDCYYQPDDLPLSDDILLTSDRNPNMQGCLALGLKPTPPGMTIRDMLAAARRGALQALLIADLDLFIKDTHEKAIISALEEIPLIIAFQKQRNKVTPYAHYIFPVTCWAEMEGTFTNFEGRVQKFERALEPPQPVFPLFRILNDLARACGLERQALEARQIFSQITENRAEYNGLSWDTLGETGTKIEPEALPIEE